MKQILFAFICLLIATQAFSANLSFRIFNNAYAYNAENGTDWEQTRYTMTYFEDLFLPYFVLSFSDRFSLTAGVATVVPFHQQEEPLRLYPYIRSTVQMSDFTLNLGNLDNKHDFASPVQDPLIRLVPQIRTMSKSRIPINYENFPLGIFSHGFFEYGIQLKWWQTKNPGELYMNWQLADTTNHRERFDVGLSQRYFALGILPFYASLHYWHNGGHENPHPVSITENYVFSAGLRNDRFNLLYLYSYFLPDRDNHPEQNKFGQALYISYVFDLFDWNIECEGFASSAWIANNQQFISIESDPFYRTPLYLGLNINRTITLTKEVSITLSFVNGSFLTDVHSTYSPLMIRYDQSIQINFDTELFSGKKK